MQLWEIKPTWPPPPPSRPRWEALLLFGLTTASLFSIVLAWRRDDLGGFVLIFWGLVFCGITYVTSQPQQIYSMLVTGVPFLIAGLFFLASWWLDQGTSNNAIHTA